MKNNQNNSKQKGENKKKGSKLFLWISAHKAITAAIATSVLAGATLGTLAGIGVFTPKGGNGGEVDPEPDSEPPTDPLKFTATESSTVGYKINGELNNIDIQVSRDNGDSWEAWPANNYITLNNNESICVWNKNNSLSDNSNFFYFDMPEGKISASGKINSMINCNNLSDYCYQKMFKDCINLISVPELPATTLANSCYYEMFAGCAQLISAPELPATTLANSCYTGMFNNCYALTSTPELPATQLAGLCYKGMFAGCNSLTAAPTLPATTLKEDCYNAMFGGCTSLQIRQEIGETSEPNKIFTCPDTSSYSTSPVNSMFAGTGGDFTGTPTTGNTYYYN